MSPKCDNKCIFETMTVAREYTCGQLHKSLVNSRQNNQHKLITKGVEKSCDG